MRARIALFFVLFSCARRGREIGPAPERSVFRSAPAPTTSSSVPVVDALIGWAGEVVSIDGEIVVPKHEHIEESIVGKHPLVVALASRGEVVVYFDALPTCARLRMTGKAFVLHGLTPKTHAAYAEVALDATRFDCH